MPNLDHGPLLGTGCSWAFVMGGLRARLFLVFFQCLVHTFFWVRDSVGVGMPFEKGFPGM